MPMAKVIKQYLDRHGVKYDVIEHAHTSSSMHTAEAAGIPGDQLAKSIVLKDKKGCLMAVLPATHRLDVKRLNTWLDRTLEPGPVHPSYKRGAAVPNEASQGTRSEVW